MFAEICGRPLHQQRTVDEARFCEYFEQNGAAFSAPFSQRLDVALKSLTGLGELADASSQQARISERLHSERLRDLRQLLGLVLIKRQQVAILIDNLDEPWEPGHHVKHLSELLLGLLRVAEDLSEDFHHSDHWRKPVNVVVTVFLRSDIFAFIQPLAPEQDKLPIQRIVWDDPELLLRMLDMRLEYSAPTHLDAREIRRQLFPDQVVGLPTSEFIMTTVLHRPRDVIFLVRTAIDGAVNRGHNVVAEADLLDARDKYSEYVFRSILAEDDPQKGKLEAVLFEFAGARTVNNLSEVRRRIARAGVESQDVEFYIDLLCDVSFLKIQTANGFKNSRHEAERQVMRQVARRLAIDDGAGEESYAINSAFSHVLQID